MKTDNELTQEQKALREKMQARLDCGHTIEEHLAAALIVSMALQLNMPHDVLLVATRIIANGEHDADVQQATSTPHILAPMGHV